MDKLLELVVVVVASARASAFILRAPMIIPCRFRPDESANLITRHLATLSRASLQGRPHLPEHIRIQRMCRPQFKLN